MSDTEHSSMIERATIIINNSHLSAKDKELIVGRVPFITDSMLNMFVELCDEDPFSIEGIVKSLKKKLDTQGNLVKLHEIIKQERQEIEDLISANT